MSITKEQCEAALRAVANGVASEYQQKAALNYIMNDLCRFGAVDFDGKDPRFNEGKRAVAWEMLEAIKRKQGNEE